MGPGGQRQARVTSGLVATVVFLTATAPPATDMDVPTSRQVAGNLQATATQVQLILTTFFVGMALGQLVGGPVSDQRGRRRPLLAAVVAMALASVVCALAAGAGMLVGALWFDTPLVVATVRFFVLMTAQGLIGPNGGALASAEVPDHPRTGTGTLSGR